MPNKIKFTLNTFAFVNIILFTDINYHLIILIFIAAYFYSRENEKANFRQLITSFNGYPFHMLDIEVQ